MNTDPSRRTFVKKTSAGLLGLTVLDILSPSAHAAPTNCLDAGGNVSNPDAACNTGTAGNKTPDAHCGGQNPANSLLFDEDGACGNKKTGSPADQDESCSKWVSNTSASPDEACDKGHVSQGAEPDEACSATNRDESCQTYSTGTNSGNPDESCGFGGALPNADQHCTGTSGSELDYDNTNSYLS